jgi:DNA-binding response OmpR family regulator
LYESIWGRPANDSVHNVVTLIYRLRKKIGLKDGGVFEIRRERDNRYCFLKIKYGSEW